jgi:multiple sugar transport system ATP-binding protein
MARVRLENVTKCFGEVVAVKDFNLDIEDGEFIILVGPSGCGKTTTLRAIAGLEDITSGGIYIGEREVTHLEPKDRDIAMVFQNYALYPHMNVYNNMAFGLRMGKAQPKDRIEKTVKETAVLLGIGELLDRKPKELSGGQRQRVALGRAIVRQPKVFLFDEPLSNLDAKLRISMRAELLGLHQRLKSTTIYVTHDQLEAMTMADRIVIMKDGLVQQVGPPEEIYDHPVNRYVAGFVGSPTMNFVACALSKGDDGIWAVTSELRLRIPRDGSGALDKHLGKDVVLGIRPEHIDVVKAGETGEGLELGTRFDAQVWVVEPLGSDKLVYVKNGEDTLVARLDPHVKLKSGDRARFSVRMELARVFDGETGETLL